MEKGTDTQNKHGKENGVGRRSVMFSVLHSLAGGGRQRNEQGKDYKRLHRSKRHDDDDCARDEMNSMEFF